MKKTTKFAAVCVLAVLCGCAGASELAQSADDDWLDLVRRYTSADTLSRAEDSYKWQKLIQDSSGKSESFLAEWWNVLGDDMLTELIDMAFASNSDLRSARAKVLTARAQLGISVSSLRPKGEGNAGYTHGMNSDIEDFRSYNKYALGIDASWELDFFGRGKHLLDSAKAELESEYASLHDAWVSLSAEVAVNYVTLRTLQAKLAALRKNAQLQEEILALLESQYRAGLKDALAVQQERYTLEKTRAEIPSVEQGIQEAMNVLAVLTGELPGSLNECLAAAKAIPAVDVSNLIGIPAQTLRQRPDIRAAERKLSAQIAARKAAEKAGYPAVRLIGSIGLESLSTGNLFSSGAYNFSIGPKVTWPIFNGGQIRRNIQVQGAREEQLAAELDGVILRAAAEVRDALSANAQEIERNARLSAGVRAAQEALEIARDRYLRGLAGFSDVLSAQQALSDAEEAYTESGGQKVINLVKLFKSLGGGWVKMN